MQLICVRVSPNLSTTGRVTTLEQRCATGLHRIEYYRHDEPRTLLVSNSSLQSHTITYVSEMHMLLCYMKLGRALMDHCLD